jgi:hypothetical protein
MDEVENLKPKNVEAIKELITKSSMYLRRAYTTLSQNYPRRCSFCGTANGTEILHDITGNRRFLCHNVLSIDYKLKDFNLFGSSGNRKVRKAQNGKKSNQAQAANTKTSRSGVNHDLNMRLDVSFRKQASITRDIASRTSAASSGNSALKVSFMADYTLSRLMTITAYYDQQTNTPLLANSSYPTTTRDFGLSLKFSLTR